MSSKAKAIAVFDISSSSVGGAHALLEQREGDTGVTFLVQERRDSGFEDELDIERFVNDTARALEVVIDHVRTADVHHPEYIQVVLSSPWYSSYTRTISYKKDTTFSCTRRLVDSLIEKEVAFLLQQPNENGTAFGSGFKLVEQQLSLVLLNGYETADPYGKKAQAMELTLVVTLVPEIVVERFTSILRRSYGDRPIHVTTGAHAAFVALRDNGGIAPDSAIIDVGEEVTDVALVKNGLFVSQHSFPVGTYELYRALKEISGSTVEARALVEGYRLRKLSPSNMRIVEKALHLFSTAWIKSLRHTVEGGQSGFHFPSQYYICTDQRFEQVLSTLVAEDEFLRQSTFSQELHVSVVDDNQVSAKIKTMTSEVPDTGLLTGILFSERV